MRGDMQPNIHNKFILSRGKPDFVYGKYIFKAVKKTAGFMQIRPFIYERLSDVVSTQED